MRRFILPILTALLLLLPGCVRSARTGELRAHLVPQISDATVALVRRDNDGDVGAFCTGVWVAPTVILTAAHCVAAHGDGPQPKFVSYITKDVEPEIYEEPRAQFSASVRVRSTEYDLALLDAAPLQPHAVAKLASMSPYVGDDVTVVGSTIGLTWSVSGGTVEAYRNKLRYMSNIVGPTMQLQSAAYFGNSGGPVFDMDGYLVGIVVELSRAPTINVAVHRLTIQAFLRTHGVVP